VHTTEQHDWQAPRSERDGRGPAKRHVHSSGRNLPVQLSQAGIAELTAASTLSRKRHLADTTAQVVSRTFSQGTVEGIVFPDGEEEFFVESHLQNRGINYDRCMLVSKKHRPHVLGALLRQLNQVVDDAAFVFVVEKSD
jgi:hypothetical protein